MSNDTTRATETPAPVPTGGALRASRNLLVLLAVGLLVAGVGLGIGVTQLVGGSERSDGTATSAAGGVQAPPRPAAPAGSGGTPQLVRSAPPTDISIPRIKARSSLVGLRLETTGELQVPTDYSQAGWYVSGPAPGDRGPAVVVGHVDSKKGPAIFYRLTDLKAGDTASVGRSDGSTVTFVVDRTIKVAKNAFPTQQVYGPTSRPELRLITCDGDFDDATGHYRDNFVVFLHEQGTGA